MKTLDDFLPTILKIEEYRERASDGVLNHRDFNEMQKSEIKSMLTGIDKNNLRKIRKEIIRRFNRIGNLPSLSDTLFEINKRLRQ